MADEEENPNRLESMESNQEPVDESESEISDGSRSGRKLIPTKKAEKICLFCERNFNTRSKKEFENHAKKCKKFHKHVRGENSNKCALCEDKEFSTQGILFNHLEKMHEKQVKNPPKTSQNISCNYCEETILSKFFKVHVKACQKYEGFIKGLQCQACLKKFTSRHHLLGHLNSSCFKKSKKNGDVSKPKKKIPQKTRILEELECPNCQTKFDNEELLTSHVEICSVMEESTEDPLVTMPSTKQCSFCEDLVPKEDYPKHLDRCTRSSEFVQGLACTLCPEKKFKDKRFVYKHVILFHVPVSPNDVPVSPHDDIISQYDMDTVIEGANEDQGTEGGPRIEEVFGTARQDSEGATGLVRSDYFRNPYFQDKDPNIVTKLFVCPLCRCKFARVDHAQNHVVYFHKINLRIFKALKEVTFGILNM